MVFLKYFEELKTTELRRKKERTLRIAWIMSLAAPLITGLAFYYGRTTVLLANFFRRSSELLSLFLSWYVFKKVSSGPDENYNYGYYKMEDAASLVVGLVMNLSFILVLYNGIHRFRNPTSSGWLLPGLIIAGGGLIISLWFWQRNYRLSKRKSTPIFEAQWRLYRAKALIDFTVFLTLFLNIMFEKERIALYVDSIGSILISFFLLVSGILLIKKSLKALLDQAPLSRLKVEEAIKIYSGKFEKIHDIRSRKAGGKIFLEVEIRFNSEKKVKEVNQFCQELKELLNKRFPGSKIKIVPV